MERKIYFESLDAVKGLAIFLVVLGHSIQCGSGSVYYQEQSFFDNVLFMFVYSFHMPLFMIISGFLYGKGVRGRSILSVLGNRSVRLLLPIVTWQTLVFFTTWMRGREFDVIEYLYSVFAGFWFLWSVWWATIAFVLIEAFGKTKRIQILFHLLLILLGFLTPDDFNFSLHKFMYCLFLTGYAAARFGQENFFRISRRHKFVCLLTLIVIYIVAFQFFQRDAYIYISGWSLIGRADWGAVLGWDIYRFFIGVVGSATVILLVHLIAPKEKWKLLKDMGKSSIGIYILQTYAVVIMMKFSAGMKPQLWFNVVEAILICTGCYIGVKFLYRFPNISFMLFGQQPKGSK